MSRTERLLIEIALLLLVFLVPAFVVHTSPRFAGSFGGFVLGVAAATLMVLLLIYPLAKHSSRLRPYMTRVASLHTLLVFHVFAGILGALLIVLHTGHKYQSPLGITLMISMLVVVVTGVIGRYYLPPTAIELREAQSRLAILRGAYDRTAVSLAEQHTLENVATQGISAPALQQTSLRQLVEGIADLEYAIGSKEAVKRIFARWMVLHVVASILLYLLVMLHVAGELYYGLRWLS